MSLTWFRPPKPSAADLATYPEHLHPLGVRLHQWRRTPPHVDYYYEDDELVAEVGAITVYPNGIIEIWPYAGCDDRDRFVLAACAQLAFEEKPTKRLNWHCRRDRRRTYWETIVVAIDDGEGSQALIARHHESITDSNPRLLRDEQRQSRIEVAP